MGGDIVKLLIVEYNKVNTMSMVKIYCVKNKLDLCVTVSIIFLIYRGIVNDKLFKGLYSKEPIAENYIWRLHNANSVPFAIWLLYE